ncbi:DUF4920 domain-containing protein [Glaciecola sp. KUL10]|uniref:DUF4920 domain-containing protein n=1 Tax=Glaciecola sp. (strain KUL10) TaxID=2161813 RepID=UPI000D786DE8|nr:DUF4920 domain-containing protein [Glaciecola sp. KUL10]GBL05951.1 hypothetical protein KUL10_32840 [Glaciecola sp. KUL10]
MNIKASVLLGCFTLTFVSFAQAVVADSNKVVRLSEPVLVTKESETFGAVPNNDLKKLSLTELMESAQQNVGHQYLVATKITKVCQKKGCFFIAQEAQHAIRVSFKDYGFFIPSDSSNKQVKMTGELVQIERAPAQAKHFKDDLKTDSSALNAGVVYEFVADSIVIPKT